MKINVLIVEDDPITGLDIREILEENGMKVIDCVTTGEVAVNIVKRRSPDVIIMDIKLEGKLDGIEAAKKINQNDFFPIIYLTSYTDRSMADKAFDTNPSAFLSKPFDEKDLIYAIELAFKNHCDRIFANSESLKKNHAIFLKSSNRYYKVSLDEIQFFKAEGSYSIAYTINRTYSLSSNLHTVEKNLKHPNFLRVHRSYLINIDNVDGFDSNYLYINNKHIPYSKSYRKKIAELLKKFS